MSLPRRVRFSVQGQTHSQNMTRSFFLASGLLMLGCGFIGLVVPGWPTTVFWIVALYCFKRSSPRFEAYLLNHPLLGATLRDWDENKWISRRVKAISCGCIFVFSGLAIWLAPKVSVKAIIAGLAVAGIAYILTRRTKPDVLDS